MNDRDFMRYSRQILLDDIALDGQQKLLDSQVLIIGLGGLGTPAALYLAGAGVGTLVLADDDDVHLSNLQRQILFTTEDIDRPKSQVSHQRLTQLNPDIQLTALQQRLTGEALKDAVARADVVLDCTGVYGNREHGEAHLAAGAKKVLFSHPGSNDLDATVVFGVNQHELQAEHLIVSNASCTTNCIIPVIKLLDDAYGIESGTVTTIHSAMHDQQVIDAYHPDLRRTRAASQSIIPVDTKLAAGITRIFPQFNDRFEAIAVRVPTINVTAIDLSVTVKKPVKACEVNLLLQKAAQGAFHGIVDYTELPLVSVDFNHDPHSAIVDGTQTRVSGAHLIKTLVWCDNEWGFANRMLDTTLAMAAQGFR